jgi:hypothetical protein
MRTVKLGSLPSFFSGIGGGGGSGGRVGRGLRGGRCVVSSLGGGGRGGWTLQALVFSFVQGIFSMGLAQQLFVGFVQWTAFGGKVGHQRWQLGHFADAHPFVGSGGCFGCFTVTKSWVCVAFRGEKKKGFRSDPTSM